MTDEQATVKRAARLLRARELIAQGHFRVCETTELQALPEGEQIALVATLTLPCADLTADLPEPSLQACGLCRSYTQSLERRSKALATGRDAAQTPPRAPKLPRAKLLRGMEPANNPAMT